MNKLKDLWRNNKVAIVLGFILLICIVAIVMVSLSFFFGGNKSIYGDRLIDIDKYPVTDAFKSSYISSLEEDESIESAAIDVKGRIIYVTINFIGDTTLLDAEAKAANSLSQIKILML